MPYSDLKLARLSLPPSVYSGPHQQSIGPARTVTRDTVRLRLQLQQIDLSFVRSAVVEIDVSGVKPIIDVTPIDGRGGLSPVAGGSSDVVQIDAWP